MDGPARYSTDILILTSMIREDWLPQVVLPEGWRAWVEEPNQPLGEDEISIMTLAAPSTGGQWCAYLPFGPSDVDRCHGIDMARLVWLKRFQDAITETQERYAAST